MTITNPPQVMKKRKSSIVWDHLMKKVKVSGAMIFSMHIPAALFGIRFFGGITSCKTITYEEEQDDVEPDMISLLPDDILISIITLTSTKDVVRTSILSKRWKNLYKFVPDFYFTGKHFIKHYSTDYLASCATLHNSQVTVSALDRFLRLHSSSKIRSFSLSSYLNEKHTDRFEQSIIESLGMLGIEQLGLHLLEFHFSFSLHLLSKMPSLINLKLSNCFLKLGNNNSKSNSLKTLTLHLVKLLPGALECILSNCLCLETLTLINCNFPSKKLSVRPQNQNLNLQLKSLTIHTCIGVEEIKICASNLITFNFENEMANFIFEHVPQLQCFYLNSRDKHVMPYVYGELAKDLPRLKSFTFTTCGVFYEESLRTMESSYYTFSRLRQLKLILTRACVTDLLSVTPFLNSCPILEEFHLVACHISEFRSRPQVRRDVVSFLHPNLKKVEICGFHGSDIEIEFALYILKSALVLEQMRIHKCFKAYIHHRTLVLRVRPPWSEDELKMINEKLQGQAISKIAQVIIQHH